MKALAWIFIALLLVIGGIIIFKTNSSQTSTTNTPSTSKNTEANSSENIIEKTTIDLVATSDFEGSSGTATREFDGTNFNHSIKATLPDPPAGKFYEGWLVNGDNFFSTGPLTKIGDTWELNFTAQLNYPDHVMVVVTEETQANGYDNIPETHVLEGDFE